MGSIRIPRTVVVTAYVGLLVTLLATEGLANLYSNSFISPNSAEELDIRLDESIKTSQLENIKATFVPENGDELRQIKLTKATKERFEKSTEPILSRTSAGDNLLLFKNVEESLDNNDVELSGRIGRFIQPSKTDKNLYFGNLHSTIDPASGEDHGALQPKSLQEPQAILPSATTKAFATQLVNPERPRQANADIQDIITGIVKLLNGNVNVQANTAQVNMGRPLRPLSTRINNRGPPKISDVPALPPDFDIPSQPLPPPATGPVPPPMSSRLPTPYPFELPNISQKRPYTGISNIPLSDQVMPGSKRPGFYRPVTIPPWNRRRPTKRPNPNIPVYKPMPHAGNSDTVSLTSEKPMDDIFTLNMGTQFEEPEQADTSYEVQEEDHDHGQDISGTRDEELELPAENDSDNKTVSEKVNEGLAEAVTSSIKLEQSENMDQETSDFEKNKEKNPKPDKTTKVTIVTPTLKTDILEIPISLVPDDALLTIEPNSVTEKLIAATIANDSSPIKAAFEATASLNSSGGEPILESSIEEVAVAKTSATQQLPSLLKTDVASEVLKGTLATTIKNDSSPATGIAYQPYRPRPGIVLDDTEYKPGGINRQPIITRPPIGAIGDIFDVTVSAIQGPGEASVGQGHPYVIPVDIETINSHSDVITSPIGEEGFVSIDGKRTYLNLFGDNPPSTSVAPVGIKPSAPSSNQVIQGTGYVELEKPPAKPTYGSVKPAQRRPTYGRPRPSQPPVRIDTCIVGDDSTCDASQHEVCRTELGVSACHCRAGTARRKHRDPCRKIVSVLLSLRVDRIYERRVVWASELLEKNSESYEQLSYEAERALESAMSMTPFSDEYLGSKVNNIYQGDRSQGQAGVFVNITLQLEENADTSRPSVRGDIQRHLLGVIQRRSNNVGNSALWVDSPPGSVSSLQDLDECSSPELHDCHAQAICINTFGSFKCECHEGLRDPWADNKHRAGRHCEQCAATYCNNRGECKYQNGQESCTCSGNYYGAQCELDGEVLGVAIGASVAAIIIIGLTLVCLVMWSRKWSREQKAAVGSPVFGYMATASNTVKTPVVGAPPYQLTLEDRLRWAQIADVMAQANHYAPEPGLAPTRPSSAIFGYPTLQMNNTLQRHPGSLYGGAGGTLPPVPLPRLNLQAQLASKAASIQGMQGMRPLDNSSSSEEEDKIDLLGRNFHVPRPKSRSNASIANQSGIYYDVDYEQNEIYKPSGIPMSTYGRAPFFRNS
ncbi:unnamed protein product [Ceutorhynchus assimilis]|uniref:EGF-like domain-containing protein n=1 Tax=Ceutorhynchus assimilis TaxID=467358 RepID=A0A9N9MKU0_9CUCU|nr:unnamed protein product [Ceutorhynchus assimilis]